MTKRGLLIFILLLYIGLPTGNATSFTVTKSTDSLGIIPLDKLWKFKAGDNLLWAEKSFNDSLWIETETDFQTFEFSKMGFKGIGWFRLHLFLPDGMEHTPFALLISQHGASEFYLDGQKIESFGKVGTTNQKEIKFTPNGNPFIIEFDTAGEHVLAVRYSNQTALEINENYFQSNAGFSVAIMQANIAIQKTTQETDGIYIVFVFLFTFFITLSFVHFLLFLFYRKQKSNLYYSVFIFLFSLFFLFAVALKFVSDPDNQAKFIFYILFQIPIFSTALLGFIYSLFYSKIPKLFWISFAILILILVFQLLRFELDILSFSYVCMATIISAIEVFKAIFKKKKGGWAIGIAAISFLMLIVIVLFKNALGYGSGFTIGGSETGGNFLILLLLITILGIPVSMSVFLARDFATKSKDLSKKLIEVEELSKKSMEQEKEKQKILATQNEILETQVKERTSEIENQKKLIEEKNKDITDSINYAKRIQEALLPEQLLLNKLFVDSFVLFKPKDIVSGDFYWFAELNGIKIVAVADCTGYGVPGALMSMIGCNILNKLVLEKGIIEPHLILNELNEEVRTALKQNESTSETRDGMDIAIINIFENQLQYAGAHRPLYIVNNGQIQELKANKFSIGGIQQEEKRVFTNHVLTLQKNDSIYLSSDGFADQFGGINGKKLMTKTFKELLINIQNQKMNEQKQSLNETIGNWKGSREQVDDILVIGIKI